MPNLNYVKDRIRGKNIKVIFADGADTRLPKAIRIMLDEALVKPIVVLDKKRHPEMVDRYPKETEIIDCSDTAEAKKWAKIVVADDYKQDLEKLIRDFASPLQATAIVLRCGGADAMLAGLTDTTREVIRTALKQIGLKPGVKLASSYFLMDFSTTTSKRGMLALADCAMIIEPDASQLAQIAIDTAESTQRILDWKPKVAMLSFSTLGSSEGPSTKKVVQATEIIRITKPKLDVIGEVQLDAAINPGTARQKMPTTSAVMGDANVLIFPNLDAGNIGYKLVEQLTGAHAYGPILQGFASNISDLSRGSTVEDIVGAASIIASRSLK